MFIPYRTNLPFRLPAVAPARVVRSPNRSQPPSGVSDPSRITITDADVLAVTGGIDAAGQPVVVLTLRPITPGWGHVNYSLNPDNARSLLDRLAHTLASRRRYPETAERARRDFVPGRHPFSEPVNCHERLRVVRGCGMSGKLPLNLDDLLRQRTVEGDRIEYDVLPGGIAGASSVAGSAGA